MGQILHSTEHISFFVCNSFDLAIFKVYSFVDMF